MIAHTMPGEFGKVAQDPFTRRAFGSDEPLTALEESGEVPVLRVAVPVSTSSLRWGTLEAGFTLGGMERNIAQNRGRSLLTSGAITLLVAAMTYLLLSLLVIRPVFAMESMARDFGGGNLGARVQPKTGDEMGRLAELLNSMARQIQVYTSSLERLVQERTRSF